MLQSPIAQVSTLLALAVVILAASIGRAPERIAAAVIGIDWACGVLFQDHRPFHHLQPVSFALDAVQAVFLGFIAVSWKRTWTLWAAAFALLLVLTHVTVLLDRSFTQWSYLTVSYLWSFGLLIAMALGVQFERQTPLQLVKWVDWARQA